jgi:hypothetical protein
MNASTGRILKSSISFVGHVAAIVVGLVLMVSGVGMGVTMVLAPWGIPLGLVGLGLFLWGVFLYTRRARTEAPVDQGEPEVTEEAKRAMLP